MPSLRDAVAKLTRLYPPGDVLRDPLQLILWENIGYLIDDETRTELFAEFANRVGFDAAAIARAPQSTLVAIANRGGMQPGTRVQRWREIARLALTVEGGDLARALRTLPLPKARSLLKQFPAIGDPGADKVVLFSGIAAVPSIESNGLRTLMRLGFCPPEKSYAASYKAACGVLEKEGRGDAKWLIAAYGVLREHGKALCRRSRPQCLACPLDRTCAHIIVVGA